MKPCDSVSQQRGRSPYRAAVVCLGLLCVLLLAGITGLGLHYQGFRGQYHAEVRDQQLRYSNLTADRDQLERERDRLENNYNTLTAERKQLKQESDQLNERIRVLEGPCPQGWQRFSSSFYHISTEDKSWAESRQDCKSKGADLVVIDSREEQTFLQNFGKRVWIGLTDGEIEGTWTWVDGNKLINPSLNFWDQGEPNNANSGEDCVEFDPSRMAWNDMPCAKKLHAVCEK
ncbi:CD209 antigen-like protein C [Osmerus mordax]|uniref:CD209 antigen-like protein C n=1 Tax=Osmerus mordax TaxID=8014 RepID=UPI00350F04C1